VVNALVAGSGIQVKLDQAAVTLPATGEAAQLSVSAGTHQLVLLSSAGHSYGTVSFSISADSSRTVVVSGGLDTAVVTVAADTATATPLTGHILLVNSAPGVGPFDVYVYRANVDSTLHFGGFSFSSGTQPGSPYRWSFPFNPGTYTFDVTAPGSTTPLASAVLTLATADEWTVVLTQAGSGSLALTATKQ
jgi:hypothetical protein